MEIHQLNGKILNPTPLVFHAIENMFEEEFMIDFGGMSYVLADRLESNLKKPPAFFLKIVQSSNGTDDNFQ